MYDLRTRVCSLSVHMYVCVCVCTLRTRFSLSPAGPTAVIPQYYGVHWGVYPANIIQQGGPGGPQRRPLSPSQQGTDMTTQVTGPTGWFCIIEINSQ